MCCSHSGKVPSQQNWWFIVNVRAAGVLCRRLWMIFNPSQNRWHVRVTINWQEEHENLPFTLLGQKSYCFWQPTNISVLLTASMQIPPTNYTWFWPGDGSCTLDQLIETWLICMFTDVQMTDVYLLNFCKKIYFVKKYFNMFYLVMFQHWPKWGVTIRLQVSKNWFSDKTMSDLALWHKSGHFFLLN